MIKALLFDFDGLILDTETTEYLAFSEVCRQYDVDMPLEVWSEWAGMEGVIEKAYNYLEHVLGKEIDREDVQRNYSELYQKKIANENILPGVLETIENGKRLGLKIGLATSATYPWAGGYIKDFGLIDHFDCIQTRENISKVKPDPEIYLTALEALSIQPYEAIAFEDSMVGSLRRKKPESIALLYLTE
jgi:putative hydrolase of the HAD superfamily